jgi:hypothetical protein
VTKLFTGETPARNSTVFVPVNQHQRDAKSAESSLTPFLYGGLIMPRKTRETENVEATPDGHEAHTPLAEAPRQQSPARKNLINKRSETWKRGMQRRRNKRYSL